MEKNYDFSGWATRNDLRCSDGRTIRKDAFKNNNGQTVPLVWNHLHNDPENVLGHALLENRNEGVYTYCTFNDTPAGANAKKLVMHGDVTALSIYANQLKQNGGDVLHGSIREVSLVLAGANPGATIDAILRHGEESEDEGIIYTGENFEIYHSEEDILDEDDEKEEIEEAVEHAATEKDNNMKEKEKKGKTLKEVFDTLTEEQKQVVYAMIGLALENKDGEGEKTQMKHNAFDYDEQDDSQVLTHADMEAIISDARRYGSLKDAVLAHGIEQIDYLFPDAKNYTNTPEWIKRPDDWVPKVLNGTHHTPMSRIKSMFANITEADARAKGYIKGNEKTDEVFGLLKRTTTPTTIYKKQSFDRDDVIDITDFDVVTWVKGEMRNMLDEEIARAILVGDGRNASSDDKINEQNIRPIWTDDDLYTIKRAYSVSSTTTEDQEAREFIKQVVKARKDYRGSGSPTLYTYEDVITKCLLIEDLNQRRVYNGLSDLAMAMRVKDIVAVPVMEGLTRPVGSDTRTLMGIVVNLNDYNVGADKGGSVNMFDDFDIDYNKQKYLIETRCSGALVKPYSAIVIEQSSAVSLTVEPEAATTTILGKSVADLQSGVLVHDTYISGSLKYVTGYTGYSGEPSEQSGNYLAIKVAAPAGATTTLTRISDAGTRTVTFDSDMNAVIRVTDERNMKLKVSTTTSAGVTMEKTYSLVGLKLKNA